VKKSDYSNRNQNIATNLRLLLKHYSLSFRKLAKIIGVGYQYLFRLSKAQHASPGIASIEKIARVFKISVAQMIGEKKIDFKKLPKDVDKDCDCD